MHSKKPLAAPLKVTYVDGEVVCLGDGSVNFSMTLEAASLTNQALTLIIEAAQRELAAGARLVILLVEDEAMVRIHTAEGLGDAGYTVIEAANAAEALEELENGHDIRLMFTDVNMPGSLDGLGLARLVSQRWPAVTVLVTSGLTPVARSDLPPYGRFLPKPYAFDDLLREVRELIAR